MTHLSRRRFAALGAMATIGAAMPLRYAHAAEFVFKLGTNVPESHPLNVYARKAAEEIKQATDGRFELQVFANNQLGGDSDMFAQLRSGALECFTLSGVNVLSSLIPSVAISGTGFAFKDYPTLWRAMDGRLGENLRSQITKAGIVVLDRIWDNGFRMITTSAKPIRTPDDLANMKIRVPVSAMWISLFRSLGAAPTGLNFAEVYSALQTKVVDGQENPPAIIHAARLYEVQKYASITNHMWDGWWFLINRRAWSRVPGDMQETVARIVNAACMQELLQQKPAVSSAIDDVERDLTRLALAEAKNPKGCLANPGPNTTNMCDWNYEYFASIVTDAFSAQLERDVSACTASISGAQTALPPPNQNAGFAVTKSATRQELVYPCVQRRDFSTSAPEITEFIAKSGSYLGEQCEVERQNRAIKDLQAGYADLFKGLEWDGGSGRVRSGESDALTLGDSTLGASFDYATAWELQRTKTQGGSADTLRGCGFEGAASQVAKATIRFFGSDQEILYSNGAVKARSVPGHVRHQARLKDLDSGRYRWLTPPTANDGLVDRDFAGPDEVLPRWTPPLYLADLEQSYWIVIGEFPVKITLGFGASAGLLFKFAGRSGDNCADTTLKSPTNFRLLVEATPYAQANAFADASLNYPGVAAAGVRLDLELLRLGLPMGVDIAHPREDWSFRAGGRVTIDMLSGSLSAYVSVGAWPFEVTFWAKLMDWDGYHESFPLWGIERSVPGPAVRTLLAKYVDLGNVSCTNDSVRNASCSNLTYPTRPAQAPCPGGGCSGAGGAPEYRTIDSIVTQPKDWYLCRFSEYDRNRLTTYKNACTGFTR